MVRKSIPKSVRFEVFKRDSFKCQYCGASSPDVLLVIDHIKPVAGGGESDITNLITACQPCNSGKSDRPLSDTTIIRKRKAQLDQLQERREQLEMMAEWHRGLVDIESLAVEQCVSLRNQLTPGWCLNEYGVIEMKKHLKKFGVPLLMQGIRASAHYLELGADGKITPESINEESEKLPAICVVMQREREEPGSQELYKIRAYLRRNLNYLNEQGALNILTSAMRSGVSMKDLWRAANSAYSWTGFSNSVEQLIAEAENAGA